MPKRIPAELKRVSLNCLIAPATMRAINETVNMDGGSQGIVIDRAIALLCFGDEIRTAPITAPDVATAIKSIEHQMQPRAFKGYLARPGEKK